MRRLQRFSPLLLLLAACPPPPVQPHKPDRVTLTILSTNDLHGQLDPIPHKRFPGEVTPLVGGARALAATVAELRAQNPGGTILVDAGDFMQGTLVSGLAEGAPVRDLFHLLGHDAVAVGNHEFDFGPEGDRLPALAAGHKNQGALKAWAKAARFKVLSANITGADGRPLGWPNVLASTEVKRRGVRVGIIGLTTTETPRTAFPAMIQGLRFQPLLQATEREAARLRGLGVQVVLVVAHAGGVCPTRDARDCSGELFSDLLAKLKPGLVDVVIGGHTHRCIWHRYRGMLVAEASSHGRAVGRVELTVDRRTGRVVPGASRALPPRHVCHQVFAGTNDCDPPAGEAGRRRALVPNPLLARHRKRAAAAGRIVERYRKKVRHLEHRKLAEVARAMSHDRFASSEVATFFARAMLEAVPGADFAVFNPGGVRAVLPAGTVTYRHVFEAMPFENRVASARLTGAELRRLLEIGTAKAFGIFQVAGLRLTARCGDPDRLVSLTTPDGKPLNPSRLYTVVLSDYLLTGGDGVGVVTHAVPQARKKVHGDLLIRDVIARKLRAAAGPVNTSARPVISREAPPVVVTNGPCRRKPKKRGPLCR